MRPNPPRAVRHFNLLVAGMVFLGMLGFAGWLLLLALSQPSDAEALSRALAGALIGGAAVAFLAALGAEWRSGESFQHNRKVILAVALLGLGTTVLVLPLG